MSIYITYALWLNNDNTALISDGYFIVLDVKSIMSLDVCTSPADNSCLAAADIDWTAGLTVAIL